MRPKIQPPDDEKYAGMTPEERERARLYEGPFSGGLEFDAVTITALLGAAIAFNFFVVANL